MSQNILHVLREYTVGLGFEISLMVITARLF